MRRFWGFALADAGRQDESLKVLQAAITSFEKAHLGRPGNLGYWHFWADTYRRVGMVLVTQGHRVEAEQAYRQAVAIHEKRAAELPGPPYEPGEAGSAYSYLAAMLGTKLVFPRPFLDPESLLENFVTEKVTWTAGVPTIWLGMLQLLDANPGKWDLSHMKGMLVGGSAVPRAMIAAYKERHGLSVVQGWGMTETSPVASVTDFIGGLAEADQDTQFDFVSMAGVPLPFVELRARVGDEEIPWDAEAMGELEVRGPWVAAGYYEDESQADRWTDDGWFKTGDIVSMHPKGFIQIKDRSKDVIKSGGEWISSVELENALMAHPAVAEAAVIGIPDEKWAERPLAAVVVKEGMSVTQDELREFLAPRFAKWWLPDRYEFVAEIPKTAVGKFRKTALREQFAATTLATSS